MLLITSFSAAVTIHIRESFCPGFLADVQLSSLQGECFAQQLVKFQSLAKPAFSSDGTFLSFVGPVKREGMTMPAVYILDAYTGRLRQKTQHADWQGVDVVAKLARPLFSVTWSSTNSCVLVCTFISMVHRSIRNG